MIFRRGVLGSSSSSVAVMVAVPLGLQVTWMHTCMRQIGRQPQRPAVPCGTLVLWCLSFGTFLPSWSLESRDRDARERCIYTVGVVFIENTSPAGRSSIAGVIPNVLAHPLQSLRHAGARFQLHAHFLHRISSDNGRSEEKLLR